VKRFFFVIFLLLLLAGGAWFYVEGLVYVPAGQILVVFDEKEHRVIGQYGEGFVPIYLKLIPGRVSLHQLDSRGALRVSLSAPLPKISELEDQLYSIRCSFSLKYSLVSDKYLITEEIINKEKPHELITSGIEELVKGSFSYSVSSLFSAGFDAEKIALEWPAQRERLFSELTSSLSKSGIELESIEQSSPLVYPTNEIYAGVLVYYDELQSLRRRHGLDNETLKGVLAGESLHLDAYCRKLEKISALIEKNPLLLQYMYIEKLGSNVSVILPASISGYPFGLDRSQNEKKDVLNVTNSNTSSKDEGDAEVSP